MRSPLRVLGLGEERAGSTNVGLAPEAVAPHARTMNKRTLATVLWAMAGWTLGLMVAWLAGLPSLLGPAFAGLFAAIVWWDPTGRLWHGAR